MSNMRRDKWGYASYCLCAFLYTFKKTIAFGIPTNKLLAAIELPHLHNSPVQSAWGGTKKGRVWDTNDLKHKALY
jgi:hypothetical protein